MGSSATVVAKHREHLKQLINRTINKQGPNCDLNFIDVSKGNVYFLSQIPLRE